MLSPQIEWEEWMKLPQIRYVFFSNSLKFCDVVPIFNAPHIKINGKFTTVCICAPNNVEIYANLLSVNDKSEKVIQRATNLVVDTN